MILKGQHIITMSDAEYHKFHGHANAVSNPIMCLHCVTHGTTIKKGTNFVSADHMNVVKNCCYIVNQATGTNVPLDTDPLLFQKVEKAMRKGYYLDSNMAQNLKKVHYYDARDTAVASENGDEDAPTIEIPQPITDLPSQTVSLSVGDDTMVLHGVCIWKHNSKEDNVFFCTSEKNCCWNVLSAVSVTWMIKVFASHEY